MTTFERVRRALAVALETDESELRPETRIRAILRPEAPDAVSGGEARVHDLSDDSLDLIEFTMLLETSMEQGLGRDLDIPNVRPDALARLISTGTLQDLVDLIDGKTR